MHLSISSCAIARLGVSGRTDATLVVITSRAFIFGSILIDQNHPKTSFGDVECHHALLRSRNCRIWGAIMRFSSVGMTHAETRDSDREMRGPPSALAFSSSGIPIHSARLHTRAPVFRQRAPRCLL